MMVWEQELAMARAKIQLESRNRRRSASTKLASETRAHWRAIS